MSETKLPRIVWAAIGDHEWDNTGFIVRPLGGLRLAQPGPVTVTTTLGLAFDSDFRLTFAVTYPNGHTVIGDTGEASYSQPGGTPGQTIPIAREMTVHIYGSGEHFIKVLFNGVGLVTLGFQVEILP